MTAKEMLRLPEKLKAEIATDTDELAVLRSVLESSSGRLDRSGIRKHDEGRGKFEDVLMAIAEAEERIDAKVAQCATLEKKLLALIRQLGDARYRKILIMRYFGGYSLFEAAEKLGRSKSVIFQIHREALKALDRIIREEENGKEAAGHETDPGLSA